MRSAERPWIRDPSADTLSHLTGAALTLPLPTCLGWLPQSTHRLQDRDPSLQHTKTCSPSHSGQEGRAPAHTVRISWLRPTSFKALLPKCYANFFKRHPNSLAATSTLQTQCQLWKASLIISKIGNLKIFFKRSSLLQHKRK